MPNSELAKKAKRVIDVSDKLFASVKKGMSELTDALRDLRAEQNRDGGGEEEIDK